MACPLDELGHFFGIPILVDDTNAGIHSVGEFWRHRTLMMISSIKVGSLLGGSHGDGGNRHGSSRWDLASLG